MTVIGVPCINRPDLLERFLRSVDTGWPVVVIDNSDGLEVADAADRVADDGWDVSVVSMPSNLGVAASWNLIIRTHTAASWWCIANADAELAPGDLDRLALEMDKPGPRWVGMNGDWRVFGINRECVEAAGLFDEGFYPCYLEDCDYEYRCSLVGVPWYFIDGGATHEGSAAIRSDPRLAARNAVTYPANLARYREKWGGTHRGGETFTTPWNKGGSVRDWTLELSRLRELRW